jgi:hypothetical protein
MSNPIDNVSRNVTNTIMPFLDKFNIDSNGLIALSSLFGVASLYHLNRHEMGFFIFYTLVFYFLDLGIEKQNMNNMFKNIVYLLIFAYLLFVSYDLSTHYVLLLVLGVAGILWYLYTSCNNDGRNEICTKNADTLKMFGNGSIILILLLVTIYLNKFYCKKHVLDVSKPFVW